MYRIPILFVFFRRKEVALKSFEQIRKVQPQKLYLACDGARTNVTGEKEDIDATRQAILAAVDWPCDVHTLFQKQNLGCGKGVYTAINWLFTNEEQGIILEHDCIANNSFFIYTEELLGRFSHDNRIGMIAGTNQIEHYKMQFSYCFSKYAACWGWATWRRAWKNMDIDMAFLTTQRSNVLANRGYHGKEESRWNYQIEMIQKRRVSAWDWQWYFSLASQNQLCIFPEKNLISNIGNDSKATHTSFSDIYIQSHELNFPLTHPQYVMPDNNFDYYFYHTDNSWSAVIKRNIPYHIKQIIKKFIH